MLKEGLLFGDSQRYKFIKQLGRGGFSEVWLAEDTMTNLQVAVKVYAPGAGLDDDGIKIFTQEFSMVFDMNHTNLLRPTHFACWNRMPYLIMPFIKGGSTFKYLSGGKTMSEEECWKMFHDVAAGLAYLHEKTPPLIHQDIKPDNIMISDDHRYLITDFGISARIRSTIRNGMAQEQSGGTLAYMGPERFSANPKPIMASDVWSLGAMMFELMTGLPPFGNHGGVLQKNGADIPIIEGNYSQQLKDLVYSCLAKETWDRPSAKKIEEITYNYINGIETKNQKESEQKTDHSPTSKKNNKTLIYCGIAGIIVLIAILIAVFSGNSSSNEDFSASQAVERINYDSIARICIKSSKELTEQADTFMSNHADDKFDSKYNKVEDIYISALKVLQKATDNKDSLSASLKIETTSCKETAENRLQSIFKELSETASSLKDAGITNAANDFEIRAEAIKPYISHLIENTNENSHE